jgi:hypothetical protein
MHRWPPRSITVATLPTRGKSAQTFPQKHGSRVYRRSAAQSHDRREKASSCRMKKTRRSFAFGSSQRNRMTLMFGAARFWRPGVNASLGFRFRVTPGGIRATPRRLMRRKSFKHRWISERAHPRVASCGSSA